MSKKSAALFLRHIREGTRPREPLPGGWPRQKFLSAMTAAHVARQSYGTKAFDRWLEGKGARPYAVDAMAVVFFNDDPNLAAARAEFTASWRDGADDAGPVAAGRSSEQRSEAAFDAPRTGTLLPTREVESQPFLEFSVESSTQYEKPNEFGVLGEFIHGGANCDDIELDVVIGLKRWQLYYTAPGWQPTQLGMAYGEPQSQTIDVKRIPGGWEFTPKAGSPLGGSIAGLLNHFQRTDDGAEPGIALEARAAVKDIDARFPDAPKTLSKKQISVLEAVLKTYIAKNNFPEKGIFKLGAAGLVRKGNT